MNVTDDFEPHRAHLRGVAFHMLGSLAEADDAVQEAWLRFHRAGSDEIANLRGWLTTVVARVCLDMLRARKSRREEPIDFAAPGAPEPTTLGPEQEAALADSVGLALLVVLEKLDPAERLAFVLHDVFGLPFDEIALIVGRSPAAARQLASRGRRRVHGEPDVSPAQLASERALVAKFLAALRAGDIATLITVLDPDVTVHVDTGTVIHGAENWAKGAVQFARVASQAQAALVGGATGLILAPRGHLTSALRFGFAGGLIAAVEITTDPAGLAALDVAVLD